MSATVEELVSACFFDELQMGQRFVPYMRRAEAAGFPNPPNSSTS